MTISNEEKPTQEDQFDTLTQLIRETTGLDEDQAKTIVYYAIATYALPVLGKFPLLTIYGPAGTGKTTILQILKEISYKPVEIDGKATKAALRDSLKTNTTAIIDEADDMYEDWMVNRYSRESAKTPVKQKIFGEWSQKTTDLFGAAVLHRRIPFKDPAILSRSIVLSTKRKKEGVEPSKAEEFQPYAIVLKEIAERVEWEHVKERGGSRIADTWAPLLEVDTLFEGVWSTTFAAKEIKEAEDGEVVERVPVGEITKSLSDDLALNSWQVGQVLRDLGFDTKTAGGKQYVFIGGKENFIQVAQFIGFQDEWLEADVFVEEAA